MQVILLERVVNLGNLGDIVRVKDGYGRNYLIPQGKAKRATEANKAEFEQRRAELEKQQAEQLTAAQARGEKLAGYTLQITQKAGVDGRLFGSVTNGDIAEQLTALGLLFIGQRGGSRCAFGRSPRARQRNRSDRQRQGTEAQLAEMSRNSCHAKCLSLSPLGILKPDACQLGANRIGLYRRFTRGSNFGHCQFGAVPSARRTAFAGTLPLSR